MYVIYNQYSYIHLILHFYILLEILDPDCYALVSGGDFKVSTTISTTFGDSDTEQEQR